MIVGAEVFAGLVAPDPRGGEPDPGGGGEPDPGGGAGPGAAATTAVGAEADGAEVPSALVADSSTRIVWPTSPAIAV